jgi:hypothetical protein
MISIARIEKFLTSYAYIDKAEAAGSTSILIDEDLFVYIVERYDGLSRMSELVENITNRSSYVSRHIYELNMRSMSLLSNQLTVRRLINKSTNLSELFRSTLTLLAGEVKRLIKEEAQMCVLDPTFNIDTLVNDEKVGQLDAISPPLIQ